MAFFAPPGTIFPFWLWPLSHMIPKQVRPKNPLFIVSLGYGVTGGDRPRLARATAQSLLKAVNVARRFPHAFIIFGNSSHTLNDGGVLEEQLKYKMLDLLGFPHDHVISAGPIDNTVNEMRAIRDKMRTRLKELSHVEVLLITVPIHGAVDVWQRDPMIKEIGRLSLQYVKDPGYQRDSILKNQRTALRWLVANVARNALIFLACLFLGDKKGLDWVAKIGVHKVAKTP